MLVASLDGIRIEAAVAERGTEYRCPNPKCNGILVLRKPRKIVANFAHKPPYDCTWVARETRAHLEAKALVHAVMVARPLRAEVEFVVNTLMGDRRADVMVWSPLGKQIAVELQHTSIDLNAIEARAASYANAGIAQIWIPFIRSSVWTGGKPIDGGWFVERYAARPFERWVHGLNGKRGMWMYDPAKQEFWLGRMKGHLLFTESSTYFSEGEEQYSSEGYRWSKLYKELTMTGPHKLDALRFKVEDRKAFKTTDYNWPAGKVAHLTPTTQDRDHDADTDRRPEVASRPEVLPKH